MADKAAGPVKVAEMLMQKTVYFDIIRLNAMMNLSILTEQIKKHMEVSQDNVGLGGGGSG